ncbi:MAG: hypothetical protein ACRD0D_02260 [Acidimicrobiales bacterium]
MTERWAELRVGIDPDDVPLVAVCGDQMSVAVGDDIAVSCELQLPLARARQWAAELFDAIAVAHREATGDPHALSDLEVAFLPDPGVYQPGPGLVVEGDEAGPARVRLHVAIDVEGRHLHCASLRAAVVEALAARFNTTRVAVSAGTPLAGRVR